MDTLFSAFSFLASGFGILLAGALAAAIVLVWDWRFALIALFLVQLTLATLTVRVHAVPVQWQTVQTLIIGLCCTMLALSAMQGRLAHSGRQSGGWFFRSMLLALMIIGWQTLAVRLTIPVFSPQIVQIIGWLILMALLIFSLGDSPLFTAVGLLLWCLIGQSIVAILTPIPELIAAIGLIEIVLGLTCSYLLLAERLPHAGARVVMSDVNFPDSSHAFANVRLPARPAAWMIPTTSLRPNEQAARTSPLTPPAAPPDATGQPNAEGVQ
jgi:hypothetical protein